MLLSKISVLFQLFGIGFEHSSSQLDTSAL